MENIANNMKNSKEFDYETASNEEISLERLFESVNDYLDRVVWGLEGILHQVFAPVHGMTYEEMQALVAVVEHHFLSHPVSYNQKTFIEAIINAKKQGWNIPDTLIGKFAGFSEMEEKMIEYRVYALLEMKRILADHFDQL